MRTNAPPSERFTTSTLVRTVFPERTSAETPPARTLPCRRLTKLMFLSHPVCRGPAVSPRFGTSSCRRRDRHAPSAHRVGAAARGLESAGARPRGARPGGPFCAVRARRRDAEAANRVQDLRASAPRSAFSAPTTRTTRRWSGRCPRRPPARGWCSRAGRQRDAAQARPAAVVVRGAGISLARPTEDDHGEPEQRGDDERETHGRHGSGARAAVEFMASAARRERPPPRLGSRACGPRHAQSCVSERS